MTEHDAQILDEVSKEMEESEAKQKKEKAKEAARLKLVNKKLVESREAEQKKEIAAEDAAIAAAMQKKFDKEESERKAAAAVAKQSEAARAEELKRIEERRTPQSFEKCLALNNWKRERTGDPGAWYIKKNNGDVLTSIRAFDEYLVIGELKLMLKNVKFVIEKNELIAK